MDGQIDSRSALIGLVDETSRLTGRFKTAFAEARRVGGLGLSEITVLNAVVEAKRLPTVPQIGRSLGHPRQIIQRAAKSLLAQGLIEALPNPDHKRAVLLCATERGIVLKRESDARADAIAAALLETMDLELVRTTTQALRAIRHQLETQLRKTAE